MTDASLVHGNPITYLAIPNAMAFTAIVSSVVAMLPRAHLETPATKKIVAGISLFCLLEAFRWIYTSLDLSHKNGLGEHAYLTDPLTYVIPALILLPYVITVRFAKSKTLTVSS